MHMYTYEAVDLTAMSVPSSANPSLIRKQRDVRGSHDRLLMDNKILAKGQFHRSVTITLQAEGREDNLQPPTKPDFLAYCSKIHDQRNQKAVAL